MKILFVGQIGDGQTSGMRRNALVRLGYKVVSVDSGNIWDGVSYVRRQAQQWSGQGEGIHHFNARVNAAITTQKPNLIWAEKQEYLDPDILLDARAKGILTAHYNPDPYFSLSWKRTERADACLRLYDALIVTKEYELEQYHKMARGQIFYTPLGFDPEQHQPAAERTPTIDVSFIGGWEPRREQLLAKALSVAPAIAIWGYGWRGAQSTRVNPLRAMRLGRLAPRRRWYWGVRELSLASAIRPGQNSSGEIYGARYAAAIADSRISLGLLREVCPDQHTTRTFEIPAMQGFMLADRSDDHMAFFEEGKEAEFFSSDDECLDKIDYYLRNDIKRARVAAAGRRRCLVSGYSYDDRLRGVLDVILPLSARRG